MLKPMTPDLIDYYMPENGVFHNLILGKMKTLYKGHAEQFMHAFWGVGQMSFVKHAIFVNEDAPELENSRAITEYILNRLDSKKVLITRGIIDALDHTANESLVGGKLGIDATGSEIKDGIKNPIDDKLLLDKMVSIDSSIFGLKQYFTHTKNPITIVSIDKSKSVIEDIDKFYSIKEHLKILVFIDRKDNDINEPYMLLWRVVNNIDAQRDVILEPFIVIDGTNKSEVDGFDREWPKDTHCNKEVLDSLKKRGLIDIDDKFIRKFGLLSFNG
jgi:4-hydroxy-3-polyprenylbenzoate decarboxylase